MMYRQPTLESIPAREASRWSRRIRTLLFWLIVVLILGAGATVGAALTPEPPESPRTLTPRSPSAPRLPAEWIWRAPRYNFETMFRDRRLR